MGMFSSLQPGTTVIATSDVGPVIRGQLGMVIAHHKRWRGLWRRREYVCVFLGDIVAMVDPRHITRHDHGCSLAMLEAPLWFLHTRSVPQRAGTFSVELHRPMH